MAKRLIPFGALDQSMFTHDGVYAYCGGNNLSKRIALATINDNTTMAATYTFPVGFSVETMYAHEADPGKVFVVGKGVDNKSQVWYSSDSGATFAQEILLGATDGLPGTSGNQVAMVSTLGNRGISRVVIGGIASTIIFEYNVATGRVSGGANDMVRILKRSAGGTWSVLQTWNTVLGTHHIKHGHCVRQNGDNGLIYFGSGDGNPGVNSDEVWVLEWDGVHPFTANTHPKDLGAGFSCIYGSQAYRIIEALFDGGYIYWYADSSDSGTGPGYDAADYRGIFRAKVNPIRDVERVNSAMSTDDAGRYGWFGARFSTGDMYLMDAYNAVQTDKFVKIFGSNSDGTFTQVGTLGINTNSTATFQNGTGIFSVGGVEYLYINNTSPSGFLSTVTNFYVLGNDFAEEEPDVLAPICFVDPATGLDDNNTNGFVPKLPFASTSYPLQASRLTYGYVVLQKGAVATNKITLNWSAFNYGTPARTGDSKLKVKVMPWSIDAAKHYTLTHNSADANTIYATNGAALTLELDRIDFLSEKAGDTSWKGRTALDFTLKIRDCVWGQTSVDYATCLISAYGMDLSIIRSTLKMINSVAARSLILFDATYRSRVKAIASVFEGAQRSCYYLGPADTSLQAYNCLFLNQGANGIDIASATPIQPVVKNSFFIGGVTNSIKYTGNSINNGSSNYNYKDKANSGTGNGGANDVVASTATILGYLNGGAATGRPLAGTPILNAGTPIISTLPHFDANRKAFASIPTIGTLEKTNYTFYVSEAVSNGFNLGVDTNSGENNAQPWLTETKAISAALAGDSVNFNVGTYGIIEVVSLPSSFRKGASGLILDHVQSNFIDVAPGLYMRF